MTEKKLFVFAICLLLVVTSFNNYLVHAEDIEINEEAEKTT